MKNNNLNDLINQNDPQIEKILTNPSFVPRLKLNDKKLQNFLVNKFDEIYTYIFETKVIPRSAYASFYLIMQSLKQNIKEKIFKNSKFIDFYKNFPKNIKNYSPPKQDIFFDIIQFVLPNDKNDSNLLFDNKSEFYIELLSKCDLDTVADYLISLIEEQDKNFLSIIHDINFFDTICKNIIGSSKLSTNSQKILQVCLSNGLESNVISSLTKDNFICKFIDFATDTCDRQCLSLVQNFHAKSHSKNHKVEWKNVRLSISRRKSKFVSIILNSEKFNESVNYSLLILCRMLRTNKKLFNGFPAVVSKLSNDFFHFPTNSFLHNSVLSMFKVMNKKMLLTDELVKEFGNALIKAFETKHQEKNKYMYWGQAREIFYIIFPYLKLFDPEKIGLIKEEFDREEKIIKDKTPINIVEFKKNKKTKRKKKTVYIKKVKKTKNENLEKKRSMIELLLLILLLIISLIVLFFANHLRLRIEWVNY